MQRQTTLLPSFQEPTSIPLQSLRRKEWTLLCLHSVLIAMHLVLLVIIFAGHLEHRFNVPIGPKAITLQYAIVVITQLFNVIFLATIIFLIQQLAFRRALHTCQTLTAVHDSYTAWRGVGSALSTLYSQRKQATSVWGLICVTGYLLGTSVLHITTPVLFSLATFNNTVPGIVNVTSWRNSIVLTGDDATSVLPMLNVIAQTNAAIGLNGNIVFDLIGDGRDAATNDVRPISGVITVNATAFHVTCGLLPQARQNGTANPTVWNIATPLRNNSQGYPAAPIRPLARYGIRFLPDTQPDGGGTIGSQTALLYASINVTDGQGANATTLPLNPWMSAVPEGLAFPVDDYLPTIIGCNVHTEYFKVNVTGSKNITADSMPKRTVQATWKNWEAPSISDDFLEYSWGVISNIHTLTSIPANLCNLNLNGSCQMFDYLTVPEKFLNDRLRIRPGAGITQQGDYQGSVSLTDLEMALEDMTAAVYWSMAYMPPQPVGGNLPFLYSMNTLVSNPKEQLNLNIVPVICGLVASVALFVLALVILQQPDQCTLDSEVNMVGLLQFMWLLGTGSEAQSRVARVEKPTTDNLREAGMIDVRLDSLVRRAKLVGEDDESWTISTVNDGPCLTELIKEC